jgi:hypothetical protein
MGADALRDLLGEDGLTLESVDDAMQNIQTALEDQKEIEEALRTGNEEVQQQNEYDEEDMENELSQLIQQEATITTPPILSPQPQKANAYSELSRLNQMFSSVKSFPSTSPSVEEEEEREREMAA